jgi:hypothetical protein
VSEEDFFQSCGASSVFADFVDEAEIGRAHV